MNAVEVVPQVRISKTKAESRKSHACFPLSTGGRENSGSLVRVWIRCGLMTSSSVSGSLTRTVREVKSPIVQQDEALAIVVSLSYMAGAKDVLFSAVS
jgi:hypothetical protein